MLAELKRPANVPEGGGCGFCAERCAFAGNWMSKSESPKSTQLYIGVGLSPEMLGLVSPTESDAVAGALLLGRRHDPTEPRGQRKGAQIC
jgi:hypothetical protein